jgi:autotransporter translocation and assembly factor TamB
VLTFDFDADSLNALDSLAVWIAGPEVASEAGPALRGSARVLLALQGALDSLSIDARASGDHLRWRKYEVPAGHGRVEYEPGPVPAFQVDVSLDSLRVGDYALGAASAAVHGTRDSLSWFARSRFGDLGAMLAGGRLRRVVSPGDAPTVKVGVDSLAVLLPGGAWFLKEPAELAISDSVVAITGGGLTLRSAVDSGRLDLKGDLPTRGRADAHLQIVGFPLAGVYELLERDTAGVGGRLAATVGLSGTRARPEYHGSLALSDGSIGEFRTPYVDGTFEYADQRLEAALHLWRSGQQILNVTAHLPIDLALVPVAQRELPDTLSIRARADSVDLSVLEALTPLVRDVQGGVSADLGIGGTWGNPRLQGGLRIVGAAATIPALDVRYEDVAGSLALSGDTISVRALSARSDKGRMDVSGFVRLEQLTHPILALKIDADRFKALDLKGNVTVTASGKLALTGPVIGSTLTGHATVTSGVLYFADLLEKRIVNLAGLADTSLASIIQQQGLGPEFQSQFLTGLRITDLDLDMGTDVWLRSSESNIQLTGRVTLTKDGDVYLLSGTLQAPRGTYRLKVGPVTREFVVTQGTVRYFGTPDLDADLNIEAKHTVHPVPTTAQRNPEDINVVAHITGTLSVPRVSLEAEGQDLSQTEVISYLLFGKPSFELSGDQGGLTDQRALLQSAVSVVSGELERTLVSDLGVPLDYVEIRPGAATDPFSGVQLALGRQLGAKTFLVNAGFCQGRPVAVTNTIGVSLQFRVSPEFRTQASFEPVRTCGVDPLAESQATTVPRQVGFDIIWERRY